MRVSQLLREGGGDGSDFALAVAVLAHSIGTRVRISLICLPASATAAAVAAAGESEGGNSKLPHCRMVTEARVGFHPAAAASWVGERHATGLGALGVPPPHLHFRREADGATWLSLALGSKGRHPSEQQPGGEYLSFGVDHTAAEWTTFYPMDEHGCKWHVRGAEGDSTNRVHGSPAPQSIRAFVGL